MKPEQIIICGGIKNASLGNPATSLNLWPKAGHANVRLNIAALQQRFYRAVPKQFHDLLEIATYIFAGDQSIGRGGIDVDTFGQSWRRHFHYHIPVREPDLWNSTEVKRVLRETLEFLSDDFFDFTFYPASAAADVDEYFQFDLFGNDALPPEEVMMYSGGLDSLAGAIEEIVNNKRRVALVNHRSTDKFKQLQTNLERLLRDKAGAFQPMMLRVAINKDKELGRDHYQRVRSFLYAALGGTVARMLGMNRLRFYENGVLSLNLPAVTQIVGARATRTTHPRVLAGFQKLLSLLAGETFVVENPFLNQTKGDVVKRIVDAGCGPMIAFSRSCAHTWESSNQKPQCGTCSQCLDRRIAVVVAQAEAHDPLDRYEVDIFKEARPSDEDKILGAGFIERASRVVAMRASADFLCRYPQLVDALPYIGSDKGAALEKSFALYQRHGQEVRHAVKRLLEQNVAAILDRTLPGESLLRAVIESGSVTSTPAAPAGMEKANDSETILTLGRLKVLPGFNTVLFDEKPYDLRKWKKARLCLQFLTERKAFDPESARHLQKEIDPYVREEGGLPPAPHSVVKIQDYFKDGGELRDLCKEIVTPVSGDGRYYLKVD